MTEGGSEDSGATGRWQSHTLHWRSNGQVAPLWCGSSALFHPSDTWTAAMPCCAGLQQRSWTVTEAHRLSAVPAMTMVRADGRAVGPFCILNFTRCPVWLAGPQVRVLRTRSSQRRKASWHIRALEFGDVTVRLLPAVAASMRHVVMQWCD
jgi:hypothetical protein